MTARNLSKRTGISVRHARNCAAKGWEPCKCSPAYQAKVWDNKAKKPYVKTFPTLSAAASWKADQDHALRHGKRVARTRDTVDEAADALLAGARDGSRRNRKGRSYKPSVIRSYEQDINNYIRPEFGHRKLADVEHVEIQDFVDALVGQELSASKVKNAIMPLRVIYKRAFKRGEVPTNPTRDLDLPTGGKARDRVAPPELVVKLLEALPTPEDRKLWSILFYAGPRMGEAQALRGERDVDLDNGVLHIRQSWDKIEGAGPTKTGAERMVPICDHLRAYLTEPEAGFYLGAATEPFNYGKATRRAYKAWKDAGLERFTPHQCRHTFRSYLGAIPAISEVRADRYLGHSTGSMRERYTHSFDGQAAIDAAALDEYLTGRESGTVVPLRREEVA
jgi:integrase